MKDFQEEKRKEMKFFKWQCLEPKLAILDETDSGLDIDALKDSCKWSK